jgi:hypothetical protein
MIHIVRDQASPVQMADMLQTLGGYIKLAVDIQRRVLAGGGALHADCESVLLEEAVIKRMYGEPTGFRLRRK